MNNYDVIVVGAGPAGIFLCHELKKINSKRRVLFVELGNEIDAKNLLEGEYSFLRRLEPVCKGQENLCDEKLYKYLGETKFNQIAKNIQLTYTLYANPTDKSKEPSPYIKNCEELAKKYDLTMKYEKVDTISPLQLRCLFESVKERFQYLGVDKIDGNILCTPIIENKKVIGVEIASGENKNFKTTYYAPNVVLAVGVSCKDWLKDVCNTHNIPMLPGRVDVGVRYEFSGDILDCRYSEYEITFSSLGYTVGPDEVVTTPAICRGKVNSVEDTELSVNRVTGASALKDSISNRSKNNNMAIRCVYTPFDYDDEQTEEITRIAAELGNESENGIVVQRFGDVLSSVLKDKSVPTEKCWLDKNTITPSFKMAKAGDIVHAIGESRIREIINMITAIDNIFPGFAASDNLLYAPDIIVYPKRVEVSEKFETNISGLYCVGDLAQITNPGLIPSSVSAACLAHILSE